MTAFRKRRQEDHINGVILTKRWPWILVAVFCCAWPAAALGAGGWYLLIPPRREYNERAEFLSGYKILESMPLPQWGQQGAYDSAAECETSRNSLLLIEQNVYAIASEQYVRDLRAKADPAALKTQRFLTETHNANVSAFMASRCIPAMTRD